MNKEQAIESVFSDIDKMSGDELRKEIFHSGDDHRALALFYAWDGENTMPNTTYRRIMPNRT